MRLNKLIEKVEKDPRNPYVLSAEFRGWGEGKELSEGAWNSCPYGEYLVAILEMIRFPEAITATAVVEYARRAANVYHESDVRLARMCLDIAAMYLNRDTDSNRKLLYAAIGACADKGNELCNSEDDDSKLLTDLHMAVTYICRYVAQNTLSARGLPWTIPLHEVDIASTTKTIHTTTGVNGVRMIRGLISWKMIEKHLNKENYGLSDREG